MAQPTLMSETKLFFGLYDPDCTKRVVTDSEFQGFLARRVTPLFLGFTVYEAVGYWQGKREESRVVVILRDSNPQADLDVTIICRAYCAEFNQNCVARTDQTVAVTFQGA